MPDKILLRGYWYYHFPIPGVYRGEHMVFDEQILDLMISYYDAE